MREPVDATALIERARQGDREAFDVLVREHLPAVYALVQRMVGSPEDAEDLSQECFVRAWRALPEYRGDAALPAWLGRIAVHLVRDHWRSRGREPQMAVAPGLRAGAPGEGPGAGALDEVPGPPDRGADAPDELERELRGAIERLPSHLREALVLRTLNGLSYDEVAQRTGVRPATARTHVMQARHTLARWLKPWLAEEGA